MHGYLAGQRPAGEPLEQRTSLLEDLAKLEF